jgi:phage/plasmid-like protein (TIGR03299 family)
VPALFDTGFFVRVPAWHGLGIVLDDYPSREEAMRLAGHDFDVVEVEAFIRLQNNLLASAGQPTNGPNGSFRKAKGFKGLVRSDTLEVLNVPNASYEVIQNSVAYEIAEILFDQGFEFETGITLDGGKLCALTLLLDEPFTLPGDNSVTVPFGCLRWAHDGSGSLRCNTGTIRQVCANTTTAAEAEGKRLGTDFTFRHTKNVKDRIEEAKQVVKGARAQTAAYVKAMEALCEIEVTPEQRDLFVSEIIGDRDGIISKSAAASTRVKNNIERERTKVLSLFMGDTIPVDHTLTGYGLFQAGTEYFDHLRAFRSQESYVKRTLLTHNPAKASLVRTINELVAA